MRHKRAFTMFELVFVIVVSGILAYLAIPKSNRDPLREAAEQIVMHIRYTQHLAMQDDKFNPQSSDWYKKQWRVLFHSEKSKSIWRYTVYQDTSVSGNPNSTNQIANDPQDNTKILTSGFQRQTWTKKVNKKLNLTDSYGVSSMSFSDCGGQQIIFDNLGRPHTTILNATRQYQKLLKRTCTITLNGKDGGKISIIILPETGFACIESKISKGICDELVIAK